MKLLGQYYLSTQYACFVMASLLRLAFWLVFSETVTAADAAANTVQCFCTAKDCKGPLCDGSWCLVGFKDDVDLIQTCATDSARPLVKCARKLNEWEELCSCGTDFCNTFTYMRETLKKYDEFRLAHPDVPSGFDGFDTSDLEDKEARLGEQKVSPNKHLILLLVVVPLGIGAVTVCLVFLNYHCKMC